MQTDEQTVIEAVLKGKTQQYTMLLSRYGNEVMAFVGRMIHNREDAEELTQDTFVRAFAQLRSYRREVAPFGCWIRRIAYRETLMYLRRCKLPVISLDDSEHPLLLADSMWADNVAEDGCEGGRVGLLEKAIRQLAPADQQLLHLYYNDNRPLRDIAYIVEREPAYLATRLQRIRKKLFQMIKKAEQHEQQR